MVAVKRFQSVPPEPAEGSEVEAGEPEAGPVKPMSEPEPRQRGPYVGKLFTVGAIRREICRLYRDSRQGRIPSGDCARWANVLHLAARLIEGQELERRVEILERGGRLVPAEERTDAAED